MQIDSGQLAPHFTLLGLDGQEYSLPRDLNAEPLVVVFLRVKCATCDVAFPYFNRLRETCAEGWQMWAVCQDEPAAAAAYRDRFGITYPVLLDAEGLDVSKLYDPPSTPTFYLVGPDGRIEYSSEGFAKEDINELSVRIAAYLGVEPVQVAPADDGNPAMKPGCMARQRFPNARRA
ncbi:MAG: TlpA disulfide reductase family protein [Dehalococcoidia bacterium]